MASLVSVAPVNARGDDSVLVATDTQFRGRAAFRAALLWWWMIPSAYLWHVAERSDAFLPYVPSIVWGLPGELWSFSSTLFIALVLGATYVVIVLVKRRRRRWSSLVGGALALLVTVTHLLWGIALLVL